MKKDIFFDQRAQREFKKFPMDVQIEARATIEVLARDGKLIEPYGKKLSNKLFEIRVNYLGQWRLLYAYVIDNKVVILAAFQKKSQKTPTKEI